MNDWWKEAVIYQIYPRSFQDTTGNGVGDIKGIISKVSYLKSLGVDAVWLSPIFTSPMKDMGYDVSHYTPIDPLFGTMQDFDHQTELISNIGSDDFPLDAIEKAKEGEITVEEKRS